MVYINPEYTKRILRSDFKAWLMEKTYEPTRKEVEEARRILVKS